MNFKRFTLFTLSGLILFGGLVLINKEKQSIYFPRQNSYGESSANGYMEFMKSIKTNQKTGEISYSDVEKARKQADLLPKGKSSLGVEWSFKGPDNEGGRTRAFLIDKDNSQLLYAGGATGGVYVSQDGGLNWSVFDSQFSVLNISCITQASDGSIYVGTGGHFETSRNDGKGFFFIGSGIHKLIGNGLDGNGSFETIVEPNNRLYANAEWATVGQLVSDPNNSKILYAATNQGFRVIDMTSSTPVITDPIGRLGKANDVDVTADGKMIVSFEGGDLYTSIDKVKFLKNNFPGVGRIEVTFAPSDSKIAYALMANGSDVDNPDEDEDYCMFGVYQSSDGGFIWNEIVGSSTINIFDNGPACQGNWDNAISVYTNDPKTIVIGGINLYRWEQTSTNPTNPSGSWYQIDVSVKLTANGDRLPAYVHADKHRITFDPTNQDIAYISTDGGVSKSINFTSNQPTYNDVNFNYSITQFYNLAVNSNDVVIAGSQDLGNHVVGLDFNNNLGSIKLNFVGASSPGDDGVESAMSVVNPSIGFASNQNGRIRRIQGLGTNAGNSNISVANIVSNNGYLGGQCISGFECSDVFYTTMKLWESFNHKKSKDSVDFELFSKELPPFPINSVFSEESKNSSSQRLILVHDTARTPRIPNDTLIVGSTAIDSTKNISELTKVNSIPTLIINYDTLKIDLDNSVVDIHHADGNVESKTFSFGQQVAYDNQYLSAQPAFGTIYFQIDSMTIGNKLEYMITYISTQITFYYNIKIKDNVQTILATANWPGTGNNYDQRNIMITRDAMKNSPIINWYCVAGAKSSPDPIEDLDDIISLEFSRDGNFLFFGTKNGLVYRVKNINIIQENLVDTTYLSQVTGQVRDTLLQRVTIAQTSSLYRVQEILMNGNCEIIANFKGQAVTDISSDPNDIDNLVISLGNYGNSYSVVRTSSATTAPRDKNDSRNFQILQGFDSDALPRVPAYSVLIDHKDPNKVYVGNELGVFVTDNALEGTLRSESVFQRGDTTIITLDTARMIDTSIHDSAIVARIVVPVDSVVTSDSTFITAADTQYVYTLKKSDTISIVADTQFVRTRPLIQWTEENIGMGRVPVFGLDQMIHPWPYATNTGKVYAATHGRGIFEMANFVGVPDVKHNVYKDGFKSSLKFYPNPANNNATVEFDIQNTGSVQIEVFDIRGKLVKEVNSQNLPKGNNKIKLDLSDFVNGTYIIRAINEKKVATSKFVLYR